MKPATSRNVAILAIVAIFVATVVSCVTLPSATPPVPEADVPEAHLCAAGSKDELTLTFGSYDWSYAVDGQDYGAQLLQVGPQQWDVSELAQLDAGGTTPVTVCFDETPITAYVRGWNEDELGADSALDAPLLWRARPVLNDFDSLGDEVPSTYKDGRLAFEVEPGRRYAVRTTFGSGSDHVEYVFTVR